MWSSFCTFGPDPTNFKGVLMPFQVVFKIADQKHFSISVHA